MHKNNINRKQDQLLMIVQLFLFYVALMLLYYATRTKT